MNMWTAIALIVIAGIIGGIFRDRGKNKHSREMSEELGAIHDRVSALEKDLRERVETLERIVTNPKEELKRQFDHIDKVS